MYVMWSVSASSKSGLFPVHQQFKWKKKKQENEINGKQLRSLQQRHTGNILHILTILQLNEAKKKKITTILRNETESDQLGLAIFIFSPVLTVRCLFASQTRI